MKTIEQIKQALACCAGIDGGNCKKCNYREECTMADGFNVLAYDALEYIKKLESTKEAYAILHKMVVDRLGKIVYCEDCAYYDDGYCINAVCFTDGTMHTGIYKRDPEDYCCDGEKREAEE